MTELPKSPRSRNALLPGIIVFPARKLHGRQIYRLLFLIITLTSLRLILFADLPVSATSPACKLSPRAFFRFRATNRGGQERRGAEARASREAIGRKFVVQTQVARRGWLIRFARSSPKKRSKKYRCKRTRFTGAGIKSVETLSGRAPLLVRVTLALSN